MAVTLEAALEHHRAGRLAQADAIYRELLARNPRNVDAVNLSGQVALSTGRYAEALASFVRARNLQPAFADAHQNEGNALRALGRASEALAAFDRALKLAPDNPLFVCNRGLAELDVGDFAKAVASLERAASLAPDVALIRHNLAVAYKSANRPMAALAAFEAAGSIGDAAAVRPDLFDHEGARAQFARALATFPGRPDIESNRLFAANYDPEISESALRSLYVGWGAGRRIAALPHPNMRDPARPIRIGFVSPDFRAHSVQPFLWPLISNFPRENVELYGYAAMRGDGDAWTGRYRQAFDMWRVVGMLDDEALATEIRKDGIDVLVDLAGHTLGNRLGVFARKPAPVQATWLGYGGTTGLAAIDWYIGDHRLVPPGGESAFVERVWRLPKTAFVYGAPDEMPVPAGTPANAVGYPTFGCFSRAVRLNADTFRVWGRILSQLPRARLLLNAAVFNEPETQALFARKFADCGGDAGRLELVYTSPQSATWAAYGRIDVALDPFPHNAGATTFEALWMGVPVVSKRDRVPLGRFGDSILGACGMQDWVVDSEDDYVARAVAAVADIDALAKLHDNLRARMEKSPLCDGAGFARDFAAALRGMWHDYCMNYCGITVGEKGP
jgi:protein O-GlcNAc transferase